MRSFLFFSRPLKPRAFSSRHIQSAHVKMGALTREFMIPCLTHIISLPGSLLLSFQLSEPEYGYAHSPCQD